MKQLVMTRPCEETKHPDRKKKKKQAGEEETTGTEPGIHENTSIPPKPPAVVPIPHVVAKCAFQRIHNGLQLRSQNGVHQERSDT